MPDTAFSFLNIKTSSFVVFVSCIIHVMDLLPCGNINCATSQFIRDRGGGGGCLVVIVSTRHRDTYF